MMRKDTTMTILVIRHGESEADLLDVHEGRADFELTERGHTQAEAMARYVAENYTITKGVPCPRQIGIDCDKSRQTAATAGIGYYCFTTVQWTEKQFLTFAGVTGCFQQAGIGDYMLRFCNYLSVEDYPASC